MFEYSASVWVFTIGACGVWVATLVWALRQRQKRWFHLTALGLATAFWAIGESMAIRLGKYYYAPFPLPLPGGGSPNDQDWLAKALQKLIPAGEMVCPISDQRSWDIPFPVVAFEAAILFAFLRLSILRLKDDRFRGALATAGMNALLMMNATAVLDPVVSTSSRCDVTQVSQVSNGMHFGLWHWLTNETHQGYWSGVPLVNYVAWFLAVATFSFFLRLDDGPGGFIRRHKHWFGYLSAAVVLILIFGALIPVKVAVDRVFVHGQDYLFAPHPIFDPRIWQFGVLGSLLVSGVWLLKRFGTANPHSPAGFDWVSAVPQLFVYAYCLGALIVEWNLKIFAIWLSTTAIVLAVIFWPFVARIIAAFRKRKLAAQGNLSVDV